MTDELKEEIKELIAKAILKERKRIADVIYESNPYYDYNWETGESFFSWDKTVSELQKLILKSRSEDFDED